MRAGLLAERLRAVRPLAGTAARFRRLRPSSLRYFASRICVAADAAIASSRRPSSASRSRRLTWYATNAKSANSATTGTTSATSSLTRIVARNRTSPSLPRRSVDRAGRRPQIARALASAGSLLRLDCTRARRAGRSRPLGAACTKHERGHRDDEEAGAGADDDRATVKCQEPAQASAGAAPAGRRTTARSPGAAEAGLGGPGHPSGARDAESDRRPHTGRAPAARPLGGRSTLRGRGWSMSSIEHADRRLGRRRRCRRRRCRIGARNGERLPALRCRRQAPALRFSGLWLWLVAGSGPNSGGGRDNRPGKCDRSRARWGGADCVCTGADLLGMTVVAPSSTNSRIHRRATARA